MPLPDEPEQVHARLPRYDDCPCYTEHLGRSCGMTRVMFTGVARDLVHRVVYRNESEFAAWPFNAGAWLTADGTPVVAFWRNGCAYSTPTDCSHRRRIQGPGAEFVVLRSPDQAETWDAGQVLVRNPATTDGLLEHVPEGYPDAEAADFSDPNVLVAGGTAPTDFALDGRAWISISTDGGRRWRSPTLLPASGFAWLQGRSASTVRADGVCLLCLTAPRPDRTNGRPVVFASNDGGRNWFFLSYMRPSTDDHITFCPRPVALPSGRIVAAMRCQIDRRSAWTELHASDDGGRSWGFLSRMNDVGAPADLLLLRDGRLVSVYGYRIPPYGVRARTSEDGGASWGPEIVLRDDGGSWDLGYPRALQLDSGRVLAIYYMNRADDPIQLDGGVRHIASTEFSIDP
jgi:hypothetical protein